MTDALVPTIIVAVKEKIRQLDLFFDRHAAILVIVSLILFLRLPNLSEPYWYGDEAIYLTIGQALNKGYTLYSQIIDHKTPIIYYLARVGTQFNFRVLNMMWTASSTVLFYVIAIKLFGRRKYATLVSVVYALLTTLPWFEGHIPNGELFVLGFVLAGTAVLTKTAYWRHFFEGENSTTTQNETRYLLIAGSFFGLGILTKVPALFDLAAFLAIGYFAALGILFSRLHSRTEMLTQLGNQVKAVTLLVLGAALPILASILYFVAKGAGSAYLQFGLLYNFRYAGSWQLGIQNPALAFFFTLPGKLTALGVLMLVLSLATKRLSAVARFSIGWFGLALVATLLSNRPYPHYFMQLVPAFALLTALLVAQLEALVSTRLTRKTEHGGQLSALLTIVLSSGCIALTAWLLFFLQVRPYAVASYYQNWWRFISGQLSQDDYRRGFNELNLDNYRLAKELKSTQQDKLFIWGTNPMLYALSRTTPTGRFTVAFHIKDFAAYDETYRDMIADEPQYIVVMNDEQSSFPELQSYLLAHYRPSMEKYTHFVVWKRLKK